MTSDEQIIGERPGRNQHCYLPKHSRQHSELSLTWKASRVKTDILSYLFLLLLLFVG